MRTLLLPLALVAVFAGLCCPAVKADVVVYSQPYNGLGSLISDVDRPQWIADNFTLTQDAEVTGVNWWSVYMDEPAATETFSISFYYDDGTGAPQPGSFVGYAATTVQRINTGVPYGGFNLYEIYAYSFDLPSALALNAGTPYYISIVNTTDDDDDWNWLMSTGPDGTCWVRQSYGPWPNTIPYDLAFELTAEDQEIIPEPVSATLFIGSVCLGLTRLRRRN